MTDHMSAHLHSDGSIKYLDHQICRLIEEVREAFDWLDDAKADQVRAALSQLEAILSSVSALPEKWERWDAIAGRRHLRPAAAELTRALSGEEK